MPREDRWRLSGPDAWLVTRHGKVAAFRPVLDAELGLAVRTLDSVDTDAFGAFSREIERRGTALDAARAKIAAGAEAIPEARILLASEGSFGPHPHIPFLALGDELVLLVDRVTGLEVTGRDVGPGTNFAHRLVNSEAEALEFAYSCGFPGHGVIILGAHDGRPAPHLFAVKTAATPEALRIATAEALGAFGAAWLESDMRAHRNPTRMAAIGRAVADLARRLRSACPDCGRPGFDVIRKTPGLPCADCGAPTRRAREWIFGCEGCGLEAARPAPGEPWAGPETCDSCNP